MSDNNDHLHRLEKKVDKISERLNSIDNTLAAQHVSLKEHMRRTALLEETVAPIREHVSKVAGAIQVIAVVAGAIGVMAGMAEILAY